MKLFIFLLILAAFLQTSFIPINLCLIILICRSYAVHQTKNYYCAFAIGLILSILSTYNLGFWPVIFLISVTMVHTARSLPFAHKVFTIIPLTFLLVLAVNFIESILIKANFSWLAIIASSLSAFPLYIVIREWEERFMVKRDYRLKV